MSVRKIILPKIKGRDSAQRESPQQTLHKKLDEIAGILKSMKQVDKETTSRINRLETKVNALEDLVISNKDRTATIHTHLDMAGQYARTNPSRAIEELIRAVKLLLG